MLKIKNPKLTILKENGPTIWGMALNDNNELVATGFTEETGTFETVALHYSSDEVFEGASISGRAEIVDEVNCTFEDNVIYVTDPTKDASCTVFNRVG